MKDFNSASMDILTNLGIIYSHNKQWTRQNNITKVGNSTQYQHNATPMPVAIHKPSHDTDMSDMTAYQLKSEITEYDDNKHESSDTHIKSENNEIILTMNQKVDHQFSQQNQKLDSIEIILNELAADNQRSK